VKPGPSTTPGSPSTALGTGDAGAGPATASGAGERDLIAAIRARVPPAPAWLTVGIGDDAAVVTPERGALEILTTDALVEGVHFDRRVSTPRDIGWKALAVNLSDIAAMGGTPRLALLSLGIPADTSAAALHELLDGFLALAADARVTLAGGNITRSPGPLFVDVTVAGFARRRQLLTRGGAVAGDDLYVTGEIGAAAAGLGWSRWSKELTDREGSKVREAAKELEEIEGIAGIDACVRRHCAPVPRVRFGALLGRNRAASACMDLSDGLADGVRQIAEASGLGATVDAAAVPVPAAAVEWFQRAGADPLMAAIAGGDDYELLFAVPRRRRGRLATVVRQARGLAVTRIGRLTGAPELAVVRNGAAEPMPGGFVHF
jgi:thiamine-monophosphate kinase